MPPRVVYVTVALLDGWLSGADTLYVQCTVRTPPLECFNLGLVTSGQRLCAAHSVRWLGVLTATATAAGSKSC